MKTVFIHFMHKFENEEYQEAEGRAKVLEYISAGFPIRRSVYDKETDTVFITFGCKGAILQTEEI